MKLLSILLLSLLSFPSQAEPAAFVGLSYAFGNNSGVGVSIKVLSDNEKDHAIAALGISYYPYAGNNFKVDLSKLGIDVSGGYVFDQASVLVGWDFLQHGVQVSAGWTNTEDEKSNRTSAPVFILNPAPAPVAGPILPVIPPTTTGFTLTSG